MNVPTKNRRLATPIHAGVDYLIKNGWRYTGRWPHQWTHPQISPEATPHLNEILAEIVSDWQSGRYVVGTAIMETLAEIDRDFANAGLDDLSPERMVLQRVSRELKDVIALSSGLTRRGGLLGVRKKEKPND